MSTARSTALQRFTLDNGLVIYLREDHRAPLVAAQLWYHVGASQEPTGQSGLCHLVEHLMFEGSSKLASGQYDKVMAQLGGDPNAITTPDATCFPVTLAPSRLEAALEILADSMASATLGPPVFARELEVVKAERRENIDNMPLAQAHERAWILANSHTPYATPTAGHLADLQHLHQTDVRRWYQDWYHPNNASLVVVGDIDMQTLRPLVERHFATIPAGRLPERWIPAPNRRFKHRCQTIALAGLLPGAIMAFNTPSLATATNPIQAQALRLIPQLLANGSSSRLSLRKVRGEAVLLRAQARYQHLQRGDSLLTVELYANPANATAQVATDAVMQEIELLRQTAPTVDELNRAKTRLLASLVFDRDNIAVQANAIGKHAVSGLDPNLLDQERQSIESITPEDVRATAHEYLTHERLTITYMQAAPPPSAVAPTPSSNAEQNPNLSSLQALDLNETDITPPLVQAWQTPEGTRARLVEAHELPMVDLVLSFNAGSRLDGDKPGLAALTLFMLDEGTLSLDTVQFAEQIERLGVVYSKDITRHQAVITVRCLTGDVLDEAVRLIIDMVARPSLNAAELTPLKTQLLESSKLRQSFAVLRAREAAFSQAFGSHPFATPVRGTPTGIAAISTEDLREFHRQAYSANNLNISLVGDLSREQAEAIVRRVSAALPQHWAATAPPALPMFEAATLNLEQAGTSDAVLMLLPMSARPADPDYPALVLACDVLGGGSESRLFKALRQTHGLTYAVNAGLAPADNLLYIEWEVAGEFLDASTQLVTDVLHTYVAEGPSEAELALARRALLGELRRTVATNGSLATLIASHSHQGLPSDALATYIERLSAVTPEMARVALTLRLAPLRRLLVSVGPMVDQQGLPAPALTDQ
ncbi:pitrilysin family protein [Pseudomonas sp. NBRC 111131]|uniref:M16 family metallopeptidase n=1 Tax=Pseudomonas sp. NBRC 111131 TaxID=1661046 RepID=UPI0009EB32FC